MFAALSVNHAAALDALAYEVALNGLDDILRHGDPAFLAAQTWRDTFTDETGVDTGASTGEIFNGAGGYYTNAAPVSGATGTTIGNMTAGGGLAAAFDGVTAAGSPSSAITGAGGNTSYAGYNNTLGKDYGAGVTKPITQIVIYGPTDVATSNVPGGAFKIETTTDGAVWTEAYAGAFVAGLSAVTTVTLDGSLVRGWRVNANGDGSNGVYIAEAVASERGAMSLQSVAFAFDAAPAAARVVALIEGDATVEVLDGADWRPVALEDLGSFKGTAVHIHAGSVAMAAGVAACKWRATTAAGASAAIHAIYVQGRP